MSRDVVTVRQSALAGDAARLLVERQISGLPVVDDAERLVGVVTEFDLLELALSSQRTDLQVSDVMTRDVVTIDEATPALEVADLFREHRIRRLPVLREGKVVGIVSRRELVRHVFDLRQAAQAAPRGPR